MPETTTKAINGRLPFESSPVSLAAVLYAKRSIEIAKIQSSGFHCGWSNRVASSVFSRSLHVLLFDSISLNQVLIEKSAKI